MAIRNMRQIIGAAAIALIAATASAQQPFRHAPIQVLREPNGAVATLRGGPMTSANWSGYAVTKYETGRTFQSVVGSWIVPSVSEGQSTDTTNPGQYSAVWVGIGGDCTDANCTAGDATLIQAGTAQDIRPNGAVQYYAWYELLPGDEIALPSSYTVAPGDNINVSISCIEDCADATQLWEIRMFNGTHLWEWRQDFSYGSSELSAEAIVEAPSRDGILPLPDFGTAAVPIFSAGTYPTDITYSGNAIVMQTPWGQTSNPSQLAAGNRSNVCYGFEALTDCSPP
jgi:hypothetical protein